MKAFRCSRTGLLFPGDYVEGWGSKYGIGLGPEPISEALVNDYHRKVSEEGESPMHGVSVCRAQVDLVEVTEAEFEANKAILSIDDVKMGKRSGIMQGKQLLKSAKLRQLLPAQALEADAAVKAKVSVKKAA